MSDTNEVWTLASQLGAEYNILQQLNNLFPRPFVTQGMMDVIAERARQIIVEGFSREDDLQQKGGILALAAACYALNGAGTIGESHWVGALRWGVFINNEWPYTKSWWKPRGARRDLVRAAALILAEIERYDEIQLRLANPPAEG